MKMPYIAVIAALGASTANAQDAGDVSVAAGVSTLGANLEMSYQIGPALRLRGALSGGFDASYEESDDDADFEGDVALGGLALIGDYYPLQNGWRISGGLFFSGSELNASGTADIDGLGTEAVTVSAEFSNAAAPMITTGYDLRIGDGWSLNTEAGVIFSGGIDVEISADNPLVQDQVDDDPDLQEFKDDAADIAVYPYLSLTMSYQF